MAYLLQDLNENGIPPLLKDVTSEEQWNQKRESIRRTWLDYIGEPAERSSPSYEVMSTTTFEDHTRLHIRYLTANDDEVTALLLLPNEELRNAQPNRRLPAIMALHPTSSNGKEDVATAEGRDNRRYGLELVQRGYVVLAPDTITAGERITTKAFHTADFYERNPGWTAVGKMLVDHLYGVDLLCSLTQVDPSRIGAIGHSLGGYNSFFLAGLDSRIGAYVSCCGFCTFTGDPTPERWGKRDWFSHIPRLSEDLDKGEVPFEYHEIAALAAPIPAFFYSGQQDSIFPNWRSYSEGMEDLFRLYQFLEVETSFRYVLTNGAHDFPSDVREMAYQFLDRHLQNQ
jgi:hypothetical protein